MERTVLFASKSLAEVISRELLSIKSKFDPERTVFVRVETESGFKIQNRNPVTPIRVFEFRTKPQLTIEYDSDLIEIKILPVKVSKN